MKSLVLCLVLFSSLVFVLVYAASNGFAARSPSLAPVNYVDTLTRPQGFAPRPPQVDIASENKDEVIEPAPIPVPEVKVRSERKRKPFRRTKLEPAKAETSTVPAAKLENPPKPPTVKTVAKKEPVVVKKEEPKPKPEPPKEQKPVFRPRDVSHADPLE